MAASVDWPVSTQSTSDWVTRFPILPGLLVMAGSPSFSLVGSAEVPRCRHLLPAVSRSTFSGVDAPFYSHLHWLSRADMIRSYL